MPEIQTMTMSALAVSVFPNGATDPKTVEHGTVGGVITAIRSERMRPVTKYLRECLANEDRFAYEEAKRNLPVILWSGTFKHRSAAGLASYNGLVIGDVDHRDDAAVLRDSIAGDPYIVACFVSPSGSGIKILLRTDATDQVDHGAAWQTCRSYLAKTYGLELDASGSDVCRACFACHDPAAWINEDATPLAVDRSLAAPVVTTPHQTASHLTAAEIGAGGRHAYLVAYCARLAHIGLGAPEIEAAARTLIATRFDLSDGRTIPDREIRDAVASAMLKFAGDDQVAQSAHGAAVAADLIASAAAPGPQAPAIHTNRLADPGPMPADLCTLPGLGWLWIEAIDQASTIPQPELAVGAVLTACGALIGRRLALGRGRANIYILGLAETGHGKDAAREVIKAALRDAGLPELFEEKIKSDSGIASALVGDPTKLFLIDEAGYLLASTNAAGAKSFQSGITETLLQLYTSSHTLWKAGVYADPKKNPVIDQPHVCIYATSTPGKLFSSFTSDSLDGGFIGRCQAVWGLPVKPRRRRAGPVALSPHLVEGLRAWVQAGPRGGSLACRNIDPIQVPIDQDALAHVDQAAEQLDDLERGELANLPTKAVFTRVTQAAERIALIRAWCRDQVEPRVMREDVVWAVRFALHSARRMAYHAGDRIAGDNNPFERAYQRVLAAIRGTGGTLTRNDLRRQVRLPARFIDEIIAGAVEAGEITEQVVCTERPEDHQGGGRALTTYQALP
jgi:hypothetical protein